RLRPVLCVSVFVSDAADVLLVRPVRVAVTLAQGWREISVRPCPAPRRAVRNRLISADAGGLLFGLSRQRDRSELVGVLVALDGAAVLAERTDVVLVAAAPIQRRGRRPLLACSARGRILGRTFGQGRQPSRPVFHRAGERRGAGLSPARRRVRALAMGAIRSVRVSTEPCAAIR